MLKQIDFILNLAKGVRSWNSSKGRLKKEGLEDKKTLLLGKKGGFKKEALGFKTYRYEIRFRIEVLTY